ncbi:MAG: nucleoside triphosphate pyrophosphohydrolase [Leptospiraceae bacterium]|nr:nucleoside triphosphate pyrophosphohydrolase [Leptospiraceae bacterium]MCB1305413.1 nucleoside triphosphate pyrophosphohydrolase [Leptospiraceae bacterium]
MQDPSDIPSSAEKLQRVQARQGVEALVDVAAVLREPGGCDWDREQTLQSMQPHLLEEAHELIHAINSGDIENFREELGDMLFLIIFFGRLAQEKGWFDLAESAQATVDKLIFRHPHVFGDLKIEGASGVLANWEKLKEKEKNKSSDDSVDGVFRSDFGKGTSFLPGLHRAEKLQKKAALKGFDWQSVREVRSKLDEELAELDELLAKSPGPESIENSAIQERIQDELGDVLFTVVNLARHLQIPSELAMHHACEKFTARFRGMEELAGGDLEGKSLEELEALYLEAKSRLQG